MRFLIDFIDETPEEVINDFFADHGCNVVTVYSNLGRTYLVETEYEPPKTDIVTDIIVDDNSTSLQLLSDDIVLREELVISTQSTVVEDNWWKLAVIHGVDIDQDEFSFIRAGDGVRVYVVDSGLAADHPDFAGKDVTLLHTFNGVYTDNSGHGTALSSLVVGKECGITDASLKVVKIFDPGVTTYISDLLNAFDAIITDFMQDNDSPAVVNMSWGVPRNPYLAKKIDIMVALGLVVVAAAGNSGTLVENVTPAGMESVVTVGAFGNDLHPADFSNYSGPSDTNYTADEVNYGPGLNYFAPGVTIRAANKNGGYGYVNGTSAAAAITSAVMATIITAMRLKYSVHTTYDVKKAIFARATKDLLVLEGKYASSPNLVPTGFLTPMTDDPSQPLAWRRPWYTVVAGTQMNTNIFDANVFTSVRGENIPDGMTLDDCWLSGVAPASNGSAGLQRHEMTIYYTDHNGVERSDIFYLFVYDSEEYTSDEDARKDAIANLALYCPCAVWWTSCCASCIPAGKSSSYCNVCCS